MTETYRPLRVAGWLARGRWVGALVAAFCLTQFAELPPATAHDAAGVQWAMRKPVVAPAAGPGLFQAVESPAAATQEISSIAMRTGVAANVIMRSRFVTLDQSVVDGLVPSSISVTRAKSAISGPAVRLALFGDADVWAAPQSMQRTADGYLVWVGTIIGEAGSSVSLVIKDGAITGDIFMAGRAFKIVAAAKNQNAPVHEIIEVDENAYAHNPTKQTLPDLAANKGLMPGETTPAQNPSSSVAPAAKTSTAASGPITIPIQVAYTPNVALAAANRGQDVRALVQNAINVVANVWASSGVNAEPQATIVVSDSDLPDGGNYTLADHLNFLQGFYIGPTASYAKLRQLRDAQGADLIQLIVAPGTGEQFCGIASVPSRPVTTASQFQSFSVVRNDCLGTTNAHEIGHNLSLEHDRITDNITSQTVYNVGWIDKVAATRDVMSYSSACPTCVLQRLYSSPLLTVKGVPFGVAAGGVDPSDGVRAVNESLDAITTYRTGPVNSPDASQIEMAVALTPAAPQGSTSITDAQPSLLCSPNTTGTGTVWFTHKPAVTGTTTFTLTNITGSDRICAYPAPPLGTIKYTSTGSSSPFYYQSIQVQASNAAQLLQFSLPGTAGVPVYVAVNSSTSATKPIIARAATAVPQNGWWWDPAFPGIGFALETTPTATGAPNLFLAGFFYDQAGNPAWGVSLGAMTDASTFSGTLAGQTGGAPFGAATRAATGSVNYGAISLRFTSPTTGTLTWPGGVLALKRFSIDSSPVDYSGSTGGAGFETGWYWINGDSGRGVFVEQMGKSVFGAIFHFNSDGQPTWQIISGAKVSNGSWQGDLTDSANGTTPTSPFRAASLRNNFGKATVSTSFPTGGYKILYNNAAPDSFPSTYYSAFALSVTLPGVSQRLALERFRF
jgi:hypothetical protein